MPCIYHQYERVIQSERVLTSAQVPEVTDISITPDRTQAQGEKGKIVVPARTWLARLPDGKWYLVPTSLKKEIRELSDFNFGRD